MPNLSPASTALVLVDLQQGIVGLSLAPRSGDETVATAKRLAEQFRQAGAPVVLVNVAWSAEGGDMLAAAVDKPNPRKKGADFPEGWSDLAGGLAQAGDIRITKRQWGAFYGTELDLQLRRRGVKTIVIGGIATNMGVESTVRQAYEQGYAVVVAEDACSSFTADMHGFAVSSIFPLISRVAKSGDIALRDE